MAEVKIAKCECIKHIFVNVHGVARFCFHCIFDEYHLKSCKSVTLV
jgi:hypothetical protein